MPRQRRRFIAKTPYELCFRARKGLPFAAYKTIELLIKSALARTQRDDKLVLCHDIWEGSHFHGIAVFYDAEDAKRFYEELQKKLTDYLKRLLGLDYLHLWEGRPMVAKIDDPETMVERISYLYANPAQDNLVDSIEKFPGYSSWNEFQRSLTSLEATQTEEVPWIRLPSIPRSPSPVLSFDRDRGIRALLLRQNKQKEYLSRSPNHWMKCFGIESDEDVVYWNKQIVERLREKEEEARNRRVREKKRVLGPSRLTSSPILGQHAPRKKERKIYIISSCHKSRLDYIELIKDFNAECKDCLDQWKRGNFAVAWPPGAFKPPRPPSLNALPN